MSTAGISFGGLASGLDTRSIIAALMAVERRPITALERKKESIGRQKDLFGQLDDLLDKLQTAARTLKNTTDFLTMQATSDDETIVSARASNTATPGTHQLVVHRLASAQVAASQGKADRDVTEYGDATFQFTVDGVDHFVDVACEHVASSRVIGAGPFAA